MKQRVREQIICYFLAIILLVLGMCSEIIETDSYFAYHVSTQESNVIRSVDCISKGEDFCTNSMISRNYETYLYKDYKRMAIRISFKITLLSFIAVAILQYLFYFGKTVYCYLHQLLNSHTVTVKYIHKQDGEK